MEQKNEIAKKTWYGSIVVAYRTNPVRILLIENTETGNVTTISGAVEHEETQKEAAARELQEEVKWKVPADLLKETGVTHEFIYGEKKKERAGDKGSNQVFLIRCKHAGRTIRNNRYKKSYMGKPARGARSYPI